MKTNKKSQIMIETTTKSRRHWLGGKNNQALAAITLALLAFAPSAKADNDGAERQPPSELPSPICDGVEVPSGNHLTSHLYGVGVQIYRWSGTTWEFVAPEATLFADPCYGREVATHFAGPTWLANDGSRVVGSHPIPCTPNRGAIPWLRLDATSDPGQGLFARLSFIQRLNTIGGTAPNDPGAFVGDEARVPYTADYLFYRQSSR